MNNAQPILEGSKDKEAILSSYQKYLQLSSYLFKEGGDRIYNMNEMPETSDFHDDAVRIAKDLNLSWERMTHANSNRIMLALLEEYFQNMQHIDENSSVIIETKLKFINIKNGQGHITQ